MGIQELLDKLNEAKNNMIDVNGTHIRIAWYDETGNMKNSDIVTADMDMDSGYFVIIDHTKVYNLYKSFEDGSFDKERNKKIKEDKEYKERKEQNQKTYEEMSHKYFTENINKE
jgi:hypothetical protein